MKSVVAPFLSLARCLRIVAGNGTTVRLTQYPRDLTMSNGQVYVTGSGYDFTSYAAEASFSASAVDLEGILAVAGISRDTIYSGVWDGARAYLFACDFLDPIEDDEPITASILGKATLTDVGYRFEDMALIDLLSQSVGDTYQPACRKQFGGTGFGGCGVSLAANTVTGTLTSISSALVVVDSARAEAADYWAAGSLAITSGPNSGLRPRDIAAFSGGAFTLAEPTYYPLVGGETYTLVRGCRKTQADCIARGNILRFGGFSFVPTSEIYSQIGGTL